MKTVELRGRLGRLFGKSFRFDIGSAAEAIQALCSQLPGFEDELRQGQYRVIRMSDRSQTDTPAELLHFRLGSVQTLRIVPVAAGAKASWWQVILGGVLVGAAFLLTGGTLSAPALSLLGASITGSQLALVGGLLAISGIAATMAPEVGQSPEPEKDRPSFMITSPQNLANQGHPVPWIAGKRVFAGSVVISNSITVEDFD